MTTYKNIKFTVSDFNLVETSILEKTEVSYSIECSNEKDVQEDVTCPINLSPNHRDLQSTYSADFVTSALALSGFLTEIKTKIIQSFDIPHSTFNLDDRDPPQLIDIDATWNLNATEINNYNLISPKLPNTNTFTITLPDETCVKISFLDRVYKLKQKYSTRTRISSDDPNDNLRQIASLITNNADLHINEEQISFDSFVELKSNYIFSNVTQIDPIQCPSLTFPPEPTYIGPISEGFSIKRYGIYTNPETLINNLGTYYGFQGEQANLALYGAYNGINKFDHLAIGGQCFKVRIFIVIPAFFIIIIFPLWIDVSILTTITKALTAALNTAVDLVASVKAKLDDLKSEINLKNAVALGARGVAVGKLVATGKANQLLLDAVKNFAEKQLKKVTDAKKYFELLASIGDIKKIIDKGNELYDILSGLSGIVDVLNDDQASSKGMLDTMKAANDTIDFALNEFIELLEKIPDNIVRRKALEVLRDVQDFMELIKNQAIKQSKEVDTSDPVKIVLGVLDVILYVPALKKLFSIPAKLNVMNLAYELLLEEIDQLGLVKLASELDALAADQEKSAFEKKLIEDATEAAVAIDDVAEQYKELNPLYHIDNFQQIAFEKATEAVKFATGAIDDAIDDIGRKKKSIINNRIESYLRDTLDIYKISKIARFDPKDIRANQMIINDIAGTRIYSQTGEELFKRDDFCNMPFIRLTSRLNSGGCQASRDPCGVGGYDCQEINYWHTIFKYRVSFDFYDNHDLAKGGIVTGDFDGDGIDDVWCHYPTNAKNYNPETANQILYSPLRSKITDNRVNYELTLSIDGWCDDGIVKVGDFNGDGKSDVLCVSNQKLYLLYSNGGNFYPISEDARGLISLPSIDLSSWSSNDVIVTGDFDGDGYTDIIKFTTNNIDILYGHKEDIFVKRIDTTQDIINGYQSYISKCNSAGVNRIIVSDINNDGKDDISCIAGNNDESADSAVTVFSNIPSYTNPQEEGGIIRLFVENIDIHPVTSKSSIATNVKIGEQSINNKNSPSEQLLISEDKVYNNQQTISDIHVPLECLRLGKYSLETYFTVSTEYLLPEQFIWKQASPLAVRTLNIDMSAKFVKGELIDLVSNKLQSFEYKLETQGGACYDTSSSTHFISLSVNYNATVRMSIERDNILLSGRVLEEESNQVLQSFETHEKHITFPINGQLTLNLLGVGYDQVNECN